jgi:DNA-binding NarL/FixJ family response regulator
LPPLIVSDEVLELLLLEGCSDEEIAKRSGLSRRGVTQRVQRLYLIYAITDGVKRVQLTVFLFRRWLDCEIAKRKFRQSR